MHTRLPIFSSQQSGRKAAIYSLAILSCVTTLWAEKEPLTVVIQSDDHLAVARQMVAAAFEAAGEPVVFTPAPLANEKRQLLMLEAGQTDIDIMPVTDVRLKSVSEGKSLMISVPLDRGLLGYRVCLLQEQNEDLLSDVKSAEDLRAFTMGQGEGWMDVAVYEAAGIPIKWVRDWRRGEFFGQMKSGYINLFPLGAEEILSYFLSHFQSIHPEIVADQHIVIRYPWFRFVWISAASPNAERIREALQKGFEIIAKNGKFEEIWNASSRGLPKDFFDKRRVIALKNPLYGDDIVGEEFRHLLLAEPFQEP